MFFDIAQVYLILAEFKYEIYGDCHKSVKANELPRAL